ncbi:MAG: hemolysin [Rhodobacteraceae bacterium]|nr:hemolysin [Paracoccaceae bacterium]
MTDTTYPSQFVSHRRADTAVHLLGLVLIFVAGGLVMIKSAAVHPLTVFLAVSVYVLCALVSNVASWTYHFAPWHGHRVTLRRLDHAAIYPSIAGTFTPFFVLANTGWTLSLLVICWGLTFVAIYKKLTDVAVQSKWSTASYLGLGAIGLLALPDMQHMPLATLWCIIAGAGAYVIGTVFYTRRSMPFRYAIWHLWVNVGGIFMFAGIWNALFL